MEPKNFTGDKGNKFKVISEIGRGGFGVVYRVKDKDNAQYALKLLHPSIDGTHELSFKQEIETVHGLVSENLLPVIDYGSIDLGESRIGLFVVYPFCKDGNYRQLLRGRTEIDVQTAVNQMLQVLYGLAVLHTKSIHRDLKPENILINDGKLMVADYGLAKFVDEATRTLSFKGAGTPSYMAPEVWQFKKISTATDLYAFGIMLFESLTGQLPFISSDLPQLEQMHLYKSAPRAKIINPNIPDIIDGLIKKLLIKEPSGRFQNVDEVIDILKQPISDKPISDTHEITEKIRAFHDKQEERASFARKVQEEWQMEINRNKYKEVELIDFIDEVVSEVNASLVEAKIQKNSHGPDCEYILGNRVLKVHFFNQGEIYQNPEHPSLMEELKKYHVAHGGYIEISEGGGREREGWNVVLLRSPDDMYGSWQIVESEISPLTGRATKFSPVATKAELFATNFAYHLMPAMHTWQLKRKSLERGDILKILKTFIP